jgi:hypothetical protein
MPFTLTSPNAIPPAHTLMAFLKSVIAGAKRFAHADSLRFDTAFHVMLGIERFPCTDTVRNLACLRWETASTSGTTSEKRKAVSARAGVRLTHSSLEALEI